MSMAMNPEPCIAVHVYVCVSRNEERQSESKNKKICYLLNVADCTVDDPVALLRLLETTVLSMPSPYMKMFHLFIPTNTFSSSPSRLLPPQHRASSPALHSATSFCRSRTSKQAPSNSNCLPYRVWCVLKLIHARLQVGSCSTQPCPKIGSCSCCCNTVISR